MRVERCANREKCAHKGCRKILSYEIDNDGYIVRWICPRGHPHPKPTYKIKNQKAFYVNHRLENVGNCIEYLKNGEARRLEPVNCPICCGGDNDT